MLIPSLYFSPYDYGTSLRGDLRSFDKLLDIFKRVLLLGEILMS